MTDINQYILKFSIVLSRKFLERKISVDDFVILFTYPRNILNQYEIHLMNKKEFNPTESEKKYSLIVSELFGDNDAYFTKWTIEGKTEPEIDENKLRELVKIAVEELEIIWHNY